MAGPNRVVPPLKVGPDGTFDHRYWPRTEPLPPGPPGDEGPEGPQGPKPVIVSTTEPPVADPGDLWYNPEGIPEIGDPVGMTRTEADARYIAPTSAATMVGQSLAQGPDGPAWRKDAVSADWFSNPNDAITAAGQGGTVRFSGNTIYDLPEPLQLIPNQLLLGDDANTTVLRYGGSGESVVRVRNQAAGCAYVVMKNFKIDGKGTALYGLDARLMTRSSFENIKLQWVANGGACVYFGGDQPTDLGGWSNTFIKGEAIAPAVGAAFLFDGHTNNGAGARTANNNTVMDTIINLTADPTSIGFDIVAGDTNKLIGNDVGYSVSSTVAGGIPFMLRAGARYNRVVANRSEEVGYSVWVDGGQDNLFTGNLFGGAHATISPCRVTGNPAKSSPNMFIGNMYSISARKPVVSEDAPYGTVVFEDGRLQLSATTGENVLEILSETSNASWVMGGNGSMYWPSPTSSSFTRAELLMESSTTGALRWGDGTLVKIPRFTALPVAVASRRGAMIRIEGGTGVADKTYECRKQADDTYAWVEI